ncbi:YitT family protein [Thermoactinomyces mirandus]|uniref:YitT family protein n=1 Tax=Thermoactinomyces mirandus TaxID=2756294 RepID=A0A7W1XSU5_9BACL|nr:YitT family protein [Thermoactinomyces mirandus]MBA4602639.1 YitT family protein [Thermoactinomyces mirandus]
MFIRLLVIIFSSILIAFSWNSFLLPHKVLSSGVAGIGMIISLLTPINTGYINFALNIPLLVLGFVKLGKKFMMNTILSVVVISGALLYLPVKPLSTDPILSAVFGGVLAGIGIGLIFRFSGSTGGLDIIIFLLARKKETPLGTLTFTLNAIIILISGFLFTWDIALYTMLSIYVTGKVIDMIHTSHLKLTVMIITNKGEEVKRNLISRLVRGITIVDGEGAYTKEKRKVLFMIISRYQLSEVKKIIRESDPGAFVNIMETLDVMGSFHRDL